MHKYSLDKSVEYKPLAARKADNLLRPAPGSQPQRNLFSGLCLLAAILVALGAFASSCADRSIVPVGFSPGKQLKAGEKDTIRWNFKNATKVRLSGLDKNFLPKDSLIISPTSNAELTIVAINKYSDDTLKLKYNIDIVPANGKPIHSEQQVSQAIAPVAELHAQSGVAADSIAARPTEEARMPIRGPEPVAERSIGKSDRECEYFVGMAAKQSHSEPVKLKVMQIEYPESVQDAFKLHAVILDAKGNFVTNAAGLQGGSRWIIDQLCESDKLTYSYTTASERGQSSIKDLDIAILADASFAAEKLNEVDAAVGNFIPKLDAADRLLFAHFNQNYRELIPLERKDEALMSFRSLGAAKPNGSNSAHKAIYTALKKLSTAQGRNKAIVVISYTQDNSSLLYTYNDVAELARKSGIPVYVIGIGNAVSTFANKMLAGLSEGRSYWIADDETKEITDIISEIANSTKYYYEIAFPVSSMLENCKAPANSLTFEFAKGSVAEKVALFPSFSTPYLPYQAIALFDEKSSNVPAEYDENLKLLAETLIDNPTVGIALAGHAAVEGDDNYCESIAYDRAEALRLKLIDLGVDEKQIRTRSFGAQKRIFMIEDRDWKRAFARRVELKWLDPTTLPWEIIASSESNEDAAQTKVEFWESKGKKAYFDRYIKSDNSIYKVKLWGYPTYDEARKAQKKLEKDYKKKFVIE